MYSRRIACLLMISTATLFGMTQIVASPGTVKGIVTDANVTGGPPVAGAQVLVHYDHSGDVSTIERPDVTRDTDRFGRFEIQLEPGFYDVCIMAMGKIADCQKVFVMRRQVIQHDVALKGDPLVRRSLEERAPPESPRPPLHTIRSADGKIACSAAAAPYGGAAIRQGLAVWIREPDLPAPEVLATLPPKQRDFSNLPIQIMLVPPGGTSTPRRPRPVDEDDNPVHPPFEEFASTADAFVFAIFPIDWIVAGASIVAERTVVMPDGKRAIAETRCPITAADVAYWR